MLSLLLLHRPLVFDPFDHTGTEVIDTSVVTKRLVNIFDEFGGRF